MNSRHAILENVGGKTVIACWELPDEEEGHARLVYHSKESFLLRYSNATTNIDVPDSRGGSRKETVGVAQWWLGHRGGLSIEGGDLSPIVRG